MSIDWDIEPETSSTEIKQCSELCLCCTKTRYYKPNGEDSTQRELYDTWKTSFHILEDALRGHVSNFEKAKSEGVKFSVEELAGMEKVHRLFGVN